MICSECYEIFHANARDVGNLFNNPPDTVYVCSEKCEKLLKESVANGTWMDFKGVPGEREKRSENFE